MWVKERQVPYRTVSLRARAVDGKMDDREQRPAQSVWIDVRSKSVIELNEGKGS
jgi:hypothetical protein